jgi:hypothetical protein
LSRAWRNAESVVDAARTAARVESDSCSTDCTTDSARA